MNIKKSTLKKIAFSFIGLLLLGFVLLNGISSDTTNTQPTSNIQGAVTMFVFALGTLPVLGMISFASMKFSKTLQSGLFFKVAGFLVLFFAIFNLYSSIKGLGIF